MSLTQRILVFFLFLFLPIAVIWVFQSKYVELRGETFGTTYVIKAFVPKWVSKQGVQYRVSDEFKRLDLIFSTWNDVSEISKFNTLDSTESFKISDDFSFVLQKAFDFFEHSSGYYDPTVKPLLNLWGFGSDSQFFKVPSNKAIQRVLNDVGMNHIRLVKPYVRKDVSSIQLELSSLAKGYAVDQIFGLLRALDAKRFMVEIGGEVRVFTSSKKKPWVIGITNPSYGFNDNSPFAHVAMYEGALASSGDYQNFFKKGNKTYSHIINPKTGYPISNNIASVSVYAPTCMEADGLATMLMSLGVNRGLSILESMEHVEGVFIVRENETETETEYKTYVSSGMADIGYVVKD